MNRPAIWSLRRPRRVCWAERGSACRSSSRGAMAGQRAARTWSTRLRRTLGPRRPSRRLPTLAREHGVSIGGSCARAGRTRRWGGVSDAIGLGQGRKRRLVALGKWRAAVDGLVEHTASVSRRLVSPPCFAPALTRSAPVGFGGRLDGSSTSLSTCPASRTRGQRERSRRRRRSASAPVAALLHCSAAGSQRPATIPRFRLGHHRRQAPRRRQRAPHPPGSSHRQRLLVLR